MHREIEEAIQTSFMRNDANFVMEIQAIIHEMRPDFKWQHLTNMDMILNNATADADPTVAGVAKTQQIATRLEKDEFELDKTKVEFDIATANEYKNKCRSRESRLYFN